MELNLPSSNEFMSLPYLKGTQEEMYNAPPYVVGEINQLITYYKNLEKTYIIGQRESKRIEKGLEANTQVFELLNAELKHASAEAIFCSWLSAERVGDQPPWTQLSHGLVYQWPSVVIAMIRYFIKSDKEKEQLNAYYNFDNFSVYMAACARTRMYHYPEMEEEEFYKKV